MSGGYSQVDNILGREAYQDTGVRSLPQASLDSLHYSVEEKAEPRSSTYGVNYHICEEGTVHRQSCLTLNNRIVRLRSPLNHSRCRQ